MKFFVKNWINLIKLFCSSWLLLICFFLLQEMDAYNIPKHVHEPCKRLNFDDNNLNSGNENLSSNEVEVIRKDIADGFEYSVDDAISNEIDESNEEDNMEYVLTMNPSESIEDIHARISKELIPEENMEFESEIAAHKFYKSYAKAVGFGVRLGRSCKLKGPDKNPIVPHVTLDQSFVCTRQGERSKDIRDAKVRKPRALTRCKCLAEMKISRRKCEKYKVTKFVAVHNHACVTPSKSHFIRSHRKMTKAQEAEIDMARTCGIAPRETMELMAKQVGGPENFSFVYTDCKNYLRSKRMIDMKVGDTGGVLEYLQRKKAEDPDFYSAIQVDEDGLITNILWADAKMRLDYLLFGDAVSFDTTYRKHKDGRPIALFVGVNHHKQTVIFGAALLYDETIPTFIWLFNTFVNHAMSGKKPKTIITDQDAAMKKAIKVCWGGQTVHRLCVWHINKNAAIHLGHVMGKFPDFKKDLSFCMYHYENEETFVNGWNEMIQKYDLMDNEWLKELFRIRHQWALVFGRETFCADMSTTQRSESMNSVIKEYISYKNNLFEFFENFERLLMDRRYKELQADYINSQSVPPLCTVEILRDASTLYTHTIFEMFQAQVWKAHDGRIEISGENGTISEFKVLSQGKTYYRTVTYDSINDSVSCSCKKFEFVGILCSHALKVLNFKAIVKIPRQYVLKRWTKAAKKQIKVNFQDMSKVDPKEVVTYRYRELAQLCKHFIRAADSSQAYEIAKQGIQKLVEEIDTSFEALEIQKSPDKGPQSSNLDATDDVDVTTVAIRPSKIKGIKAKEKINYKTKNRPKSCLETGKRGRNRAKKSKQDEVLTEQEESVPPAKDLSDGVDMSIQVC